MPTRDVTIINKLGLHARAAAKFVAMAGRYQAGIQVHRDGKTVNGKSIMGMMMLAAGRGTTLTLEADGEDASDALDALETLINARFEEAE
ncbi:HPr family phosphocarrier protein [Aquisalimonas sp.]|uniref:HPr family phosphocarrier protein n=1 Tax=unclassified Aquisalimonas TaxID=2644645 RepID=UPI0025BCE8BC|nr:HPr family phosphocarrier protein [Aquisalimonas sp.]